MSLNKISISIHFHSSTSLGLGFGTPLKTPNIIWSFSCSINPLENSTLYIKELKLCRLVTKPISSLSLLFPAFKLSSPSRWWLQQVLDQRFGVWYFVEALFWSKIFLSLLKIMIEKALWSLPLRWASILGIRPIWLSYLSTNTTFSSRIFQK